MARPNGEVTFCTSKLCWDVSNEMLERRDWHSGIKGSDVARNLADICSVDSCQFVTDVENHIGTPCTLNGSKFTFTGARCLGQCRSAPAVELKTSRKSEIFQALSVDDILNRLPTES